MSIAFILSKVVKKDKTVLISENWASEIEKEVELKIAYQHTTREALIQIETLNSRKSLNPDDRASRMIAWDEVDGDPNQYFAGEELFWSNKLRKLALKKGLEDHVPVILYLLRPETALISCLHFLAKELGGMRSFEEQRQFIFANPGILNFTSEFWKRVQHVYWSGVFSPSIDTETRRQIFLGLIEAFNYSVTEDGKSARGEDSLPVPHLPLNILREAGVYLPSIQRPEEGPTEEAEGEIQNSLRRQNLPGMPSDISSYLHCFACDAVKDSWKEMKAHREDPKCNKTILCQNCGISFTSNSEFNIHNLTFCKLGPVNQRKCACCGQTGPACYCQIHWKRTMQLAASVWEERAPHLRWLTEDVVAPGLLILGSKYTTTRLTTETEREADRSVAPENKPRALDPKLWNLDKMNLPSQEEDEFGTEWAVMKNGTKVHLARLESDIEEFMEIKLDVTKRPEAGFRAPKSTQQTKAAQGIMQAKFFAQSSLRQEETTAHDIEMLCSKIMEIENEMKGDNKIVFMSALGMTEQEIFEKIEEMKERKNRASLEIIKRKQIEIARKNLFETKILEETPLTRHGQGTEGQTKRESYKKNLHDNSNQHNLSNRNEGRDSSVDSWEDERFLQKKERKKEEAEIGLYTCKSEAHGDEIPPYREFGTLYEKEAHIARSHKCPYYNDVKPCPFYTEMDVDMGRHISMKHKPTKKQEKCSLCEAVVPNEHLDNHKNQIHNKCQNCSKWFKNTEELKNHWKREGGACLDRNSESHARSETKGDVIVPPLPVTMANLPDRKENLEGYVAEAIGILADDMYQGDSEENKKKNEMVKNLMSIFSFQSKQKDSMIRNPYRAQRQMTPLLKPPSFSHPPNSKEKDFNKVLDKITKIDLSPYTRDRFENFIKIDSLNMTMATFTKQFYLSESSAVFGLVAHLGQNCQETLRSASGRMPVDICYAEILKTLQDHFFNIDLKNLRDEVGRLKRATNEAIQIFYNRAYKLTSLAATNLQEKDQTVWIEQQMKEIVYKNLDPSMRMEVDSMQALHGTFMTSREILTTFIDRANFRSLPIDVDHSLLEIGKITEERTNRKPRFEGRRDKGIISTQYDSVNKQKRRTKNQLPVNIVTRSATSLDHTNKKDIEPPRDKDKDQRKETGARPKYNTRTTESRDSPRGRLARAPSPAKRKYADKDKNRPTKAEAIEHIMEKMKITPETFVKYGYFCWCCGDGHSLLNDRPYHKRNKCTMAFHNAEPHNCVPGGNGRPPIYLMHDKTDCPYMKKGRVSRVIRED